MNRIKRHLVNPVHPVKKLLTFHQIIQRQKIVMRRRIIFQTHLTRIPGVMLKLFRLFDIEMKGFFALQEAECNHRLHKLHVAFVVAIDICRGERFAIQFRAF